MALETQAYDRVSQTLRRDQRVLWYHFQAGKTVQSLDPALAEVYELKADGLPELNLTGNLEFIGGFSYIAGQWYPLLRAIGSGLVSPEHEQFMDAELERKFPDAKITTEIIRDALTKDPSGATFLEQRARVEFRQETLELAGARRAIAGIRKLHETSFLT